MAMSMEPVALGVLLVFAGAVVAAVRKVRENDLWINELRGKRLTELVDPLGSVMDGLTGAEMHRILTSCAAEGREIQRLVAHAMRTLDVVDMEDALDVAHGRLTTLIACVECLAERLEPCIDERGAA